VAGVFLRPCDEGSEGLTGCSLALSKHPFQYGDVQTLLGAEEIARRPPRETGGKRDLGKARGVETPLGVEPLRGGKDGLATALRVANLLLALARRRLDVPMIYNLLDVQLIMMSTETKLFYDLGSPYAYLAVQRAAAVLGSEPALQPVLVGGIFAMRGHGSWSQTPDRDGRIAEVESRAKRYGLPPLRWPQGWPNNTLKAMRAAVWAHRIDGGPGFARAAFRAAFAEGRDLSEVGVLVEIADSVGLPAGELATAIARDEIKVELRQATARAWECGVIGVPCASAGGKIFYGDDQLEFAAARVAAGERQGE